MNGRNKKPVVYFGSTTVDRPAADATLPAKLQRILQKVDLKQLCGGGRVPIKMHLGGGMGYTTVHPVFVRVVAKAIRDAGGQPFVVDGYFSTIASAAERGYTPETIGCPLVAAGGPFDSHVVKKRIGYRSLHDANIFGAIWEAPCLINLSHVKGHGACGHGGACKNIAMGCVDGKTRAQIHCLEGGIDWRKARCVFCGRCVKACDTDAIQLNRKKKEIVIFFHHCRYCHHCISACPRKALISRVQGGYKHFQEGMALVAKTVLDSFDPARALHINLLTDITMFCDCWGMSTPNVVPDIGVMVSHDMVAVEAASLDAIKAENFIPGSLIKGWSLGPGKHLWEKIHAKDPFVQIRALERRGVGRSDYTLIEVK